MTAVSILLLAAGMFLIVRAAINKISSNGDPFWETLAGLLLYAVGLSVAAIR